MTRFHVTCAGIKLLLLLLLLAAAIMMMRDVCDVQGVLVSVSVLTLTVISVERYYAICHPFHFKATSRRARSMIFVVWIISLIIMLPEFIVLKTFRHFPDHLPTDILTTCKPAWEYRHQVQAAAHLCHLYNIACRTWWSYVVHSSHHILCYSRLSTGSAVGIICRSWNRALVSK